MFLRKVNLFCMSSKASRAAAEDEHIVVRGSEGGKSIARKVVKNVDTINVVDNLEEGDVSRSPMSPMKVV